MAKIDNLYRILQLLAEGRQPLKKTEVRAKREQIKKDSSLDDRAANTKLQSQYAILEDSEIAEITSKQYYQILPSPARENVATALGIDIDSIDVEAIPAEQRQYAYLFCKYGNDNLSFALTHTLPKLQAIFGDDVDAIEQFLKNIKTAYAKENAVTKANSLLGSEPISRVTEPEWRNLLTNPKTMLIAAKLIPRHQELTKKYSPLPNTREGLSEMVLKLDYPTITAKIRNLEDSTLPEGVTKDAIKKFVADFLIEELKSNNPNPIDKNTAGLERAINIIIDPERKKQGLRNLPDVSVSAEEAVAIYDQHLEKMLGNLQSPNGQEILRALRELQAAHSENRGSHLEDFNGEVKNIAQSIFKKRAKIVGSINSLQFKKLEDNDYRAFYLGHILGCCQSINGLSAVVVEHGMMYTDSGFYVLEDKEGNIKAGSWAWLDADGKGLCLDTLERVSSDYYQPTLMFYLAMQKKLQNDDVTAYIGTSSTDESIPFVAEQGLSTPPCKENNFSNKPIWQDSAMVYNLAKPKIKVSAILTLGIPIAVIMKNAEQYGLTTLDVIAQAKEALERGPKEASLLVAEYLLEHKDVIPLKNYILTEDMITETLKRDDALTLEKFYQLFEGSSAFRIDSCMSLAAKHNAVNCYKSLIKRFPDQDKTAFEEAVEMERVSFIQYVPEKNLEIYDYFPELKPRTVDLDDNDLGDDDLGDDDQSEELWYPSRGEKLENFMLLLVLERINVAELPDEQFNKLIEISVVLGNIGVLNKLNKIRPGAVPEQAMQNAFLNVPKINYEEVKTLLPYLNAETYKKALVKAIEKQDIDKVNFILEHSSGIDFSIDKLPSVTVSLPFAKYLCNQEKIVVSRAAFINAAESLAQTMQNAYIPKSHDSYLDAIKFLSEKCSNIPASCYLGMLSPRNSTLPLLLLIAEKTTIPKSKYSDIYLETKDQSLRSHIESLGVIDEATYREKFFRAALEGDIELMDNVLSKNIIDDQTVMDAFRAARKAKVYEYLESRLQYPPENQIVENAEYYLYAFREANRNNDIELMEYIWKKNVIDKSILNFVDITNVEKFKYVESKTQIDPESYFIVCANNIAKGNLGLVKLLLGKTGNEDPRYTNQLLYYISSYSYDANIAAELCNLLKCDGKEVKEYLLSDRCYSLKAIHVQMLENSGIEFGKEDSMKAFSKVHDFKMKMVIIDCCSDEALAYLLTHAEDKDINWRSSLPEKKVLRVAAEILPTLEQKFFNIDKLPSMAEHPEEARAVKRVLSNLIISHMLSLKSKDPEKVLARFHNIEPGLYYDELLGALLTEQNMSKIKEFVEANSPASGGQKETAQRFKESELYKELASGMEKVSSQVLTNTRPPCLPDAHRKKVELILKHTEVGAGETLHHGCSPVSNSRDKHKGSDVLS